MRTPGMIALLLAGLAGCGGDHDAPPAQKPRADARASPATTAAPARAHVIAKIQTGQDTGLVAAFDSVWAADHREGTVSRIDPRTNSVVARIEIGAVPYDVTAGDGAIWAPALEGGRLARIDPRTNRIAASLRGSFTRLDYGVGALWALELPDGPEPDGPEGRVVARIDPATNRVVARIPTGPATGIAAGQGAVWVTVDERRLLRIDPRRNRVTDAIELPAGGDNVAIGEGAVWVAMEGGRVARVDPAKRRVSAVVRTGTDVQYLDAGEGAVWAGNVNDIIDSSLSRIDPSTAEVIETLPVGSGPQGVAVGYGDVWVASFEEGRVWRIRP